MFSFELEETKSPVALIKVVGVGGCGGNAINNMMKHKVSGVEFIAMNTDIQALRQNEAPVKVQLGESLTKGLGAGANHEVGRQAALADRDRITEQLRGADMLFIAAGMGGGTGTGAAPVVADIARELGILTVAVVIKPFSFEGRRTKVAQEGIETLKELVDSVIIIPNDNLLKVLGPDVTYVAATQAADDVLLGAVAGIAEVINCPGHINLDFADVKTVMSEMGIAMMGSAVAEGLDRAHQAANRAINSPLLEDINLQGARGILVNITATAAIKLNEIDEIMETIRSFASVEATTIFGTVIDETMGEQIRVTIVATGLGGAKPSSMTQTLKVVRTGTDNQDFGVEMNESLDSPNVMRRGSRQSTLEGMQKSGVSHIDIPTFLRLQAD